MKIPIVLNVWFIGLGFLCGNALALNCYICGPSSSALSDSACTSQSTDSSGDDCVECLRSLSYLSGSIASELRDCFPLNNICFETNTVTGGTGDVTQCCSTDDCNSESGSGSETTTGSGSGSETTTRSGSGGGTTTGSGSGGGTTTGSGDGTTTGSGSGGGTTTGSGSGGGTTTGSGGGTTTGSGSGGGTTTGSGSGGGTTTGSGSGGGTTTGSGSGDGTTTISGGSTGLECYSCTFPSEEVDLESCGSSSGCEECGRVVMYAAGVITGEQMLCYTTSECVPGENFAAGTGSASYCCDKQDFCNGGVSFGLSNPAANPAVYLAAAALALLKLAL